MLFSSEIVSDTTVRVNIYDLLGDRFRGNTKPGIFCHVYTFVISRKYAIALLIVSDPGQQTRDKGTVSSTTFEGPTSHQLGHRNVY